jgi:alkylated DNA repair protein alkB family protein 1
MHAALQEWPEPPARTNHTKAYGTTLSGLFQAAQKDLSLVVDAQQLLQQQQQQQQPSLSPPPQQQPQPQQDIVQQQSQQQHRQQKPSQPSLQPLADTTAADTTSSTTTTNSSSSRGRDSPWSSDGTGPKASLLLRKLRWVCLGPPYNWTDRLYEPHLPHRPLPPFLVVLAQQYAQLALQAAAAACDAPTRCCAAAAEAGNVVQQQQQAAVGGAPMQCCSAAPAAGSVVQQQQLVEVPKPHQAPDRVPKPYLPDAALVNYYQPGDTLNGHRDDVEPDLAQPIVTLSLGCDAVFLVGGTTR